MIDIMKIPNGRSGKWYIEEFEIPKQMNAAILRTFFQPGNRGVEPGKFKRLVYGSTTVMSNTRAELADHAYFVSVAERHVLVNGLGLGCCLAELLDKPEVNFITVIEKSKDVIKLVAPTFGKERVEIINADAYEWKPPKGVRYGAVWHDVWNHISDENLPEMTKLHRKYGRRTNWQGSWAKELCLRMRNTENYYHCF